MLELIKLVACFIMFSGALGFFLFQDAFQRFHATSKVSLFGLAILILADALIYHRETGAWSFLAYIGTLILLITGPFATHVLARSIYHSKRERPD